MNCTYCGKKIVLHPSAKERAARYGGRPLDYEHMFTAHSDCQVAAWYGRPSPRAGKKSER